MAPALCAPAWAAPAAEKLLDRGLLVVVNVGRRRGGCSLQQQEERERLAALAAQAAVENDPIKFRALVLELNQMLTEKKLRKKLGKKLKKKTANTGMTLLPQKKGKPS